MNPLHKNKLKKQPACYMLEWPESMYIGHTQNLWARFQDHIACANRGYKKTRSGKPGNAELYSMDWSRAILTVEYYDTKSQAWRREQELFRFWQPTGKLLNKELPMPAGVLAVNLVTQEQQVFSSTRQAAKALQLHPSLVVKVCNGHRMSTGIYTFSYI